MLQYKKVFLILRHCLRSTPSVTDLYDGEGERSLTYSIPLWNTPEYFCTEQGLKRISELGQFLKNNDEYELAFERIVSDIKYRDADTSMALAMELGIKSVEYQKEVFQIAPLCPLQDDYTLDSAARAEKKLRFIPTPADLEQTLAELRDALEPDDVGKNTSSNSIFSDPQTLVVTIPEKNKTRLSGSINAVKLFAQQLFYSRASGIPFHPEFSSPTKFAPWIAYVRHLLNYETVPSAVRGTILAQEILHATQSTIFVGHDTDIDAFSTVLDINYTLPGYGLTATPPGSGILLGVTRGGAVEVKYLYPTFQFDPSDATNVSMSMHWLNLREFRSEGDLARRIRIQLDEEYGAEAVQCFDSLDKQLSRNSLWSTVAFLAAACVIVFGLVLYRRLRRSTDPHPKRAKAGEDYGVVLPDMS